MTDCTALPQILVFCFKNIFLNCHSYCSFEELISHPHPLLSTGVQHTDLDISLRWSNVLLFVGDTRMDEASHHRNIISVFRLSPLTRTVRDAHGVECSSLPASAWRGGVLAVVMLAYTRENILKTKKSHKQVGGGEPVAADKAQLSPSDLSILVSCLLII